MFTHNPLNDHQYNMTFVPVWQYFMIIWDRFTMGRPDHLYLPIHAYAWSISHTEPVSDIQSCTSTSRCALTSFSSASRSPRDLHSYNSWEFDGTELWCRACAIHTPRGLWGISDTAGNSCRTWARCPWMHNQGHSSELGCRATRRARRTASVSG